MSEETRPALRRLPNNPAALAGLFFFGFVMVVLNVLIDPYAVDVTLIPRLLALLVFLVLFLCFSLLPAATRLTAAPALWHDPVVLLFALYASVTTVSLFFAVNVSAGWTDVFRAWSAFVVLVIAVVLLETRNDWAGFLAKVATVAGLLGASVGCYELVVELGLGLHERNALLGITGLMSNVNLYASFLVLVVPLCLCGVCILRGLWRMAAGLAAVSGVFLVVVLQTRAAYVALAVGCLVLAGLAFFRTSQLGLKSWTRPALVAVSCVVLAGVSLFVVLADGNLIAERVRSIFSGEAVTAAGGRLVVWKLTLQMALDHWPTGVGAGNFPVVLHDYFDIDNPEFSTIHPNWLQPHNDFLWVFAEKGLLGFLLYCGIFVAAFQHLLAALRGGLTRELSWAAVFAATGLAAYMTVGLFDFPMERINHQVYLAVYLAMVVLLGRAARGIHSGSAGRSELLVTRGIFALLLGVLLFGVIYAASALRQERYVMKARINLVEDDHAGVVANARLATTPWKTLDPFGTPVSFLEGLGHMFEAKLDDALACFDRARREMPMRNYIVAHIGLVAALRKDYPTAIDAFESALTRSPENVDVKRRLADCYIEIGGLSRAEALLGSIPADKADEEVERTRAKAREKAASAASDNR